MGVAAMSYEKFTEKAVGELREDLGTGKVELKKTSIYTEDGRQ